ncbi:MAG TPA: hypothetical protein GXZ27_05825 [Thermoanaerobacterales bacterium]|jgi:hypothetical protein|nr:hypothetical protein [Thermoanaerobacterales bacterium]
MVKNLQLQKALSHIEKLKYDSGDEVKEVKKLEKLQNYLLGNFSGLIPYKLRKASNCPSPLKKFSTKTLAQ